MSKTIDEYGRKEEELIIPTDLKTYLNNIADNRFGYRLGEPWKYSEETLGVVVPILREGAPDRQYTTIYEILKELNIKDTGSINQVELQNRSGIAIFVRAGTIFKGKTQPRAAQHSGVYSNEKEIIDVRCVNASHGISKGEEMSFCDIAPPSVTVNLMSKNQSDVWNSVSNYTVGLGQQRRSDTVINTIPEGLPEDAMRALNRIDLRTRGVYTRVYVHTASNGQKTARITREKLSEDIRQIWRGDVSDENIDALDRFANANNVDIHNSTDLLHGIKKGQSILDDMMQKVPLFDNQVGAIIFNPVGVIAVETFDHPKSWESIKKEIIEKYGDKIKEKQENHLFELKPEMILPALRKFIEGLDKFSEKTIRKDEYSETRAVRGEGIIGEYTLVKGQPIHVLLLKENYG
jgi:hypothetical protein